ncbi:MAG: glycine cleavage system protein GcvH [Acidimicrobiaceae bacterium]|nr:glycine cleavage system protein GcvH [Acidimicrobiaceae bacterium]
MELPSELRYTKDHEWVSIEGNHAKVGITDYAQDALGDIVFVQLPTLDGSVSAGESFAEVESTKSVSDIYAPVPGRVIEINSELVDSPELLNTSPYERGWICVLEMSDPAAAGELLTADSYLGLIS